MKNEIFAARAALHMWEEPCISGKEGSGAVFFTGCPLRCVFCQNREIALGSQGYPMTTETLSGTFLHLQKEGANNINLVTPTQYVPEIREALLLAKKAGLTVPVVYNTGSYELPETIRSLSGFVDIFLPDFKYCDPVLSEAYSNAADYAEVAEAAIDEMVEITGGPEFDERGMMLRGTIIRHMVLPGHTKDSMAVLRRVYERYGDRIYISIMNQYTPMPGIEDKFPELGRRVTKREYNRVVDFALELGITQAFIQEGNAAKESFIPAFDGSGIPMLH
ncbi:MAG: radical SAM protein [Lachnospiraceae bacterium]|nr:radical SAM protein [Lachnospiraceae bacterium]